jgi:hypothetical protein
MTDLEPNRRHAGTGDGRAGSALSDRRPITPGGVPWYRSPRLVGVAALVLLGGWRFTEGGLHGLSFWLVTSAVLGAAIVVRIRITARRNSRSRVWAAAHGWTQQDSDPRLPHRWSGTPFGAGTRRTATEVLRGTVAGHEVTSFTYSYETGSGQRKVVHEHHVVALDLPVPVPTLQLTPEGAATQVAKALGGQDVQLESAEFNAAWRVETTDLRFAHGVLHPRLMESLMRPPALGGRLRFEGRTIMSWAPGPTDLDRVVARATLLAAVTDAVPRHVWQDHGYDPMTARPPEE